MNDKKPLLPWLEPGWSKLVNYINQDRIPQALLVTGLKGLGKHQLAEYYAQSLMCASPLSDTSYCGKCQSCTLFHAQTHPDFTVIEPEEIGKAIGIGAIRQLVSKLSLKPQFESHRLIIINPADSLNNAAANAFLKYLEEPTERTSLILISDKPYKLSATIRSRCQHLNIFVPEAIVVKPWLEQHGISENLDLLMNISQGSPLLARQYAETSVLKLRMDCFKQWSTLSSSQESFTVLAEQWYKLDIQETNLLMGWLISWVIDTMKLSYQQTPLRLYNFDLKSDLQELGHRLNLKDLYKYYDFLLLRQQSLESQLNKQLMFEEILIRWIELRNEDSIIYEF